MSQTIKGEGDANSFQCVHRVGDAKLYKYGIKTRFSYDNKIKIQNALIELVSERANPEIKQFGIRGLQIIRDATNRPDNWQGADGMFADDILCEICQLISEIDDNEVIDSAINNISEQLADTARTSGWCPSGRVNRLSQIYMVLRDYVDGTHLSPEQRQKLQDDSSR